MSSTVPFYLLSEHGVVLLLSFVGGFVDSAGYIRLYGLFTSSITGNLVVAATALFQYDNGVFSRLFVTLLFALGAFASAATAMHLRLISKVEAGIIGLSLLGGEVLFLIAALAVDLYIETTTDRFPSLGSWQTILVASLIAFSMGIQGVAGAELVKNCPSTTVMTANIVRSSTAVANAVLVCSLAGCICVGGKLQDPEADTKARSALLKFSEILLVIAVFVIGAGAGAATTLAIDLLSLVVPLALLIVLMVSIFSGERQRRHAAALAAAAAPPPDIEADVVPGTEL